MSHDQGRSRAIRAGGIDWAKHWQAVTTARLAVREGADASTPGAWDDRAGRFEQLSRDLDPESDPLALAIRGAVRPTDSVLDVGAGAGRYTFAVAPLAGRVTAVEPSAGMRDALEQQAAARGLTNITVVAGRWEDAVVDPHDVAFVSSVLYFVADAVPFLEKLDRSARRACYIFHRVEERGAAMGSAWSELAGDRPPEPSFLDLYNVLFSLGIRPNARIVRTPTPGRYTDPESALTDVRRLLGKQASDHGDDERIRQYLAGALVKDERGLRLPGTPEMGIIWWEKP